MSKQPFVSASLRGQTYKILRDLSDRLDKSVAALVHEGALMLLAKYEHEQPAPLPQRRATDKTPAASTAA